MQCETNQTGEKSKQNKANRNKSNFSPRMLTVKILPYCGFESRDLKTLRSDLK